MATPTTHYRLGLATAAGTSMFLVLGIGALGIIGAGGRSDRIYLAVLLVTLVGSALARLRPRGMAWALAAASVTMVLATLVAIAMGLHDEPGASLLDMTGLTLMYTALFGASAWFFRRAGKRSAA